MYNFNTHIIAKQNSKSVSIVSRSSERASSLKISGNKCCSLF